VDDDAQVFRISYMNKPMKPSALSHLLIQGRGVCGESKHLQKTWHIMHRIFRNTVLPRVGNFDQIHGRLIDLMVISSEMVGQGKKLDIMDILWNEIHEVIMKRHVPIFGSLIMKLIVHAWVKKKFPLELLDNDTPLIAHSVKDLNRNKHLKPLIPNDEAYNTEDEENDPAFELPKKKENTFKKWVANAMHSIFCRQDDSNVRAWREHERAKLERQRTRQRFAVLGAPIPAGSEDRITTYSKWIGKHRYNTWVDPDLQDDASTSHAGDPWVREGEEHGRADRDEDDGSDGSASDEGNDADPEAADGDEDDEEEDDD
jgi:hypothetical protein